jgi:hypothetical protein
LGLRGEVSGSYDIWKLKLYHPEDDAVRGLVEASEATGGHDEEEEKEEEESTRCYICICIC